MVILGIINTLRLFRNEFFKEIGNKRWKRILTVSFVISCIWILADLISGNYDPNFWHDLICLGLGVIGERFVTWGKVTNREIELEIENAKLSSTNKR